MIELQPITRSSLRKYASAVALVFILISNVALSQTIYFVFSGPIESGYPAARHQTIIYALENQKNLEEMWSTELGKTARKISIHPSDKILLIGERAKSGEVINIFPLDNLQGVYALKLGDSGQISNWYFAVDSKKSKFIVAESSAENRTRPSVRTISLYSIDNREKLNPELNNVIDSYIKPSGLNTPYYSMQSDIVGLKWDNNKGFISAKENLNILLPAIDPVKIEIGSTKGWIFLANEHDFMALLSIPFMEKQEFRELLVYDRTKDIWFSMRVKGAETALRLTNDKLAGIIADQNPSTDYRQSVGYPGILREDVVIVYPLENRQLTVHLGKDCEVLWIEADSVYYRIDDSLYKARIDNDDFVDRQLLLTDPRVRYFHWAFKGSMNEEKKTIQGR
jgi:hypothetical protein